MMTDKNFTVMIAGMAKSGMEEYVERFLKQLMEHSREDKRIFKCWSPLVLLKVNIYSNLRKGGTMKDIIRGLLVFIMCFSSLAAHADQVYKRPPDSVIKQKLSAIQYKVTQQQGTEPPFNNAYWNNEEPGIYVDVVTGEPLFSSLDKYDSKTGWPSFTKPLEPGNITYKVDNSLFVTRTEVISVHGKSHLGHVFDDGPPPTNKRFCMNSAALEFIPVKDLQKRGYGKYLPLFKNAGK